MDKVYVRDIVDSLNIPEFITLAIQNSAIHIVSAIPDNFEIKEVCGDITKAKISWICITEDNELIRLSANYLSDNEKDTILFYKYKLMYDINFYHDALISSLNCIMTEYTTDLEFYIDNNSYDIISLNVIKDEEVVNAGSNIYNITVSSTVFSALKYIDYVILNNRDILYIPTISYKEKDDMKIYHPDKVDILPIEYVHTASVGNKNRVLIEACLSYFTKHKEIYTKLMFVYDIQKNEIVTNEAMRTACKHDGDYYYDYAFETNLDDNDDNIITFIAASNDSTNSKLLFILDKDAMDLVKEAVIEYLDS